MCSFTVWGGGGGGGGACVGPLLFNGCAKLLDIGRNWNPLSYTPIPEASQTCSMGDMSGEYAGHARTGCFQLQELCTDPCNMGRALSCCNMR